MDVKRIMVVGAGQLGSGIAQVAALSGLEVVLHDLRPELVEKGVSGIGRRLDRSLEKGEITAKERADALRRLVPSTTR